MSLFCCPLCAAPLEKTDRTYRCPRGHSFDRAREGSVHILRHEGAGTYAARYFFCFCFSQ